MGIRPATKSGIDQPEGNPLQKPWHEGIQRSSSGCVSWPSIYVYTFVCLQVISTRWIWIWYGQDTPVSGDVLALLYLGDINGLPLNIHVSRICDAGKGIHINLLTSHTGGSFCGRLVVCRWSRRSLYVCVNPSVTLIRIWSQPCTTVFTKPLCYDHGQTTVQYNLRCSYRSEVYIY